MYLIVALLVFVFLSKVVQHLSSSASKPGSLSPELEAAEADNFIHCGKVVELLLPEKAAGEVEEAANHSRAVVDSMLQPWQMSEDPDEDDQDSMASMIMRRRLTYDRWG